MVRIELLLNERLFYFNEANMQNHLGLNSKRAPAIIKIIAHGFDEKRQQPGMSQRKFRAKQKSLGKQEKRTEEGWPKRQQTCTLVGAGIDDAIDKTTDRSDILH